MSDRPSWLEKVEASAKAIAEQEGCYIYDIDCVGAGRGRTLRVFVDKEAGAGIDDCSKVSRELNSLLDQLDLVPGGEYQLEVSTPGVDRTLRQPWHFEKVIGKKIWLKLFKPLAEFGVELATLSNAKKFETILDGFVDNKIQIKVAEQLIQIPLVEVEKAQLVFSFEAEEVKKNLKPKGSKKHN